MNTAARSGESCGTLRRRGVTLMETIVAVLLLAVAVPPVMWALGEAQYRHVDAVLTSRARWVVMEKLEAVLADRHSVSRGWEYLVNTNYAAEPAVPGLAAYARTVSIVETGADLVSAGTGYKTITVGVTWTDASGDEQTLEISTVVTELTS